MDSFNMQKQTLLKSSPLSSQSMSILLDKKRQLLLIASQKCIHTYNILSQKLQQQLKVPNQNGPVSCLTVSDDLYFFAHGMHIAASAYNSKVLFGFDTYLAAEKIDRLHVIGWKLWVIAGNMVNIFSISGSQLANKASRKMASPSNKVQDVHSYMFDSKITSSHAVEDEFSKHYLILLLSSNQIQCYEQKQLCTYKTQTPPTTLIAYPRGSGKGRFLVGTMSGQILCLEITKSKIKQIWKIGQQISKGRINLLMEVKNQSFFVFRDKTIEIWGADRSLGAVEETDDKYVAGVYSVQRETMFTGTTSGNVVQMRDYAKMMKDYDNRNQAKAKQNLQKQIQQLKKQLQILKTKAATQRVPQPNQKITLQSNISIDYQNQCLCLQLRSEFKINKVIIKGNNIQIVKCSKLSFSQVQSAQSTFIVEEQSTKISKILFKTEQKWTTLSPKLKLLIYVQKQSITYGVSRSIDLKLLCYHHKIPKITDDSISYNELKINGEFKYFEINNYLSVVFWDFGQAQGGDVDSEVYYESILTKNKVRVVYRNGSCTVQATNPAPLVIIKQFLIQKSKQKHLNYNYSTHLEPASIKSIIADIASMLKPLETLKKQSQLLPGLLEISSPEEKEQLSEDLKQILNRKQQITVAQKQSMQKYEIVLSQLRGIYTAYQKLKDKEVSQFQLDSFNRSISNNFEVDKIVNFILA